jgi:hypothetical protein
MKSHHLEFCKSFLSCHGDYDDLVLQIDNLIYQLDYSKGRVTNLLISKINALKI